MFMNRLLTAVRALATAGLLAAPLAHADVPDPGFGLSGKATVNFDLGGNNSDRAVRLLRLADGRYIVVGEAQSAAGLRVAIARLNSDGTLDTTFDGDGRLTVDACMNQVVDAALEVPQYGGLEPEAAPAPAAVPTSAPAAPQEAPAAPEAAMDVTLNGRSADEEFQDDPLINAVITHLEARLIAKGRPSK